MKNIGKSLLYALPVLLTSIAIWHMASHNPSLKSVLLIELEVAIAILFAIALIFCLVMLTVYLKAAIYYIFKIDIKFRKKSS